MVRNWFRNITVLKKGYKDTEGYIGLIDRGEISYGSHIVRMKLHRPNLSVLWSSGGQKAGG